VERSGTLGIQYTGRQALKGRHNLSRPFRAQSLPYLEPSHRLFNPALPEATLAPGFYF